MLAVRAIGLHWLPDIPSESDLCAHAGVVVEADGARVLDASAEELAVSTAALHLLRTLDAAHAPEAPLAEQLAPHCGHYMVVDPATGDPMNGGCPAGANWWVRRDGGEVELEFPVGGRVRVLAAAWCHAVVSFADEVEAFYAASAPKRVDADEADWYAAFWREWRRRRAAARCSG